MTAAITEPAKAAPPLMDIPLERAREIVSACTKHVLFDMGVVEGRPRSLAGLSLRELLDANAIVAAANKAADAGGDPPAVQVQTVCDPRIVAALYVAYNFDPQDPAAGKVSTIATADRGLYGHAGVFVVIVDSSNDDEAGS